MQARGRQVINCLRALFSDRYGIGFFLSLPLFSAYTPRSVGVTGPYLLLFEAT